MWLAATIIVLCFQGHSRAQATCLACKDGLVPAVTSAPSAPAAINEAQIAEKEIAADIFNTILNFKYSVRQCSNFADEDEFRTWGKHILKVMSPETHPVLFEGPDDLIKVCPAYRSLNNEEKKSVWTVVLMGMAFYESSCRELPKEKRGPHGTLVGMFQFHKGMEHKYYTGGTCKKGDGSKTLPGISCALSMLEILTQRNEALFSRRSYWAVLRPQDSSKRAATIQRTLKEFPICKL